MKCFAILIIILVNNNALLHTVMLTRPEVARPRPRPGVARPRPRPGVTRPRPRPGPSRSRPRPHPQVQGRAKARSTSSRPRP